MYGIAFHIKFQTKIFTPKNFHFQFDQEILDNFENTTLLKIKSFKENFVTIMTVQAID